MRKASLFAFIGISLFILVSASVWEGAAELSEDLPENGRYIATNSLPINTVVDVTNLENGETTQLTVLRGLNTSGFLALLSKDAASALGIEKGSLSRIRLSQNPDPLAFSRTNIDPGMGSEYEGFLIIPDRPRPPEVERPVLDPSQFVPSSSPPQSSSQPQISASPVVEPVRVISAAPSSPVVEPVRVIPAAPSSPVVEPVRVIPAAPSVPVFSAPIISALEKGMYYVQVAAYRNKESVEYEITRRIGKDHPVAIEVNPDSGGEPIYRILIGPVSIEQSAEILERYRTTFNDAIVRRGT